MKIEKFISHRGAKTDYVENTMKSFQIAKDYGFKWFELDVQMSVDGVLFIFHDADTKRLCNSNQLVTDMTYDELKNIDVCDTTTNTCDKIPGFDEYLEWAVLNNVYTNVEIKINKDCEKYKRTITRKVLEALGKYKEHSDKFLISSFSNTVMDELKKDKTYNKARLFESTDWKSDFAYINDEFHKDYIVNDYLAIAINYQCLNEDRVTYLQERFDRVFVYSAKTDLEVANLLKWDVDAIFVDKKEQLNLSL